MSDKANHPPLPEAFQKLGVTLDVLRGLADAGYETPSEIQGLMIPPALDGHDILGQARTGTGKTAAFGIPMLCEAVHGYATQGIVLVPTRELAVQVEAELTMLAKHTKIRIACCYGGDRIAKQMKALKHNPEIVVGTPGRMIDLMERRVLDFCKHAVPGARRGRPDAGHRLPRGHPPHPQARQRRPGHPQPHRRAVRREAQPRLRRRGRRGRGAGAAG